MIMKTVFTIAFLFCVLVSKTTSQEIQLFSVNTSNYPTVSAKFRAVDANGNRAVPNSNELRLFENNQQRTITSISCPSDLNKIKPVSIVLTLDNSGSMSSIVNGESNMEIAKKAAVKLISSIPNTNVEVAVTSFDNNSMLRQDFTKDKTFLTNAVNSIVPSGGTDYNAGLLNPPSGALLIAKKAKFSRSIIFLTDGISNSISEQDVINEALSQNCRIYIVCVGINAPAKLINIANATDGLVFDKVVSGSEAENIFSEILDDAQGVDPCSIEWTSLLECSFNINTILFEWNQFKDTASYIQPKKKDLQVSFDPNRLAVSFKGLSLQSDTTILFTSNYTTPIQVTAINSSNPLFTIFPTNFIINPGETIPLNVSYNPFDSSYNYTQFSIKTNECEIFQFATGGFRQYVNKQEPLTLVKPNGGEVFVAGIDTVIRWKNVPPIDTVSLHYSIDNGRTWELITNKAGGLVHNWKAPKIASDSCLVKVVLGNKSLRNVDSNDISLYHTVRASRSFLTDATWSNDGNSIYYLTAEYDNNNVPIKKTITELYVNTGLVRKIIDLPSARFGFPGISKNPLGNELAYGDSILYIVDAVNNTVIRTVPPPSLMHYLIDIQWSPDGTKIAISYSATISNKISKILVVYDYSNNVEIDRITYDGTRDSRTIKTAWSPDSRFIAISGFDPEILVYDFTNKVSVLEIVPLSKFHRQDIEWSPDGSQIMTASGVENASYRDRQNIIYNSTTGSKEASFVIPTFSDAIAFNPMFSTVVFDSASNVVEVDLKTLLPSKTYRVRDILNNSGWSLDRYRDLEYSPNGRQLMGAINFSTAPQDKAIIVWENQDTLSQMDVSDSVFRIVIPELKTQQIDMGKVLVGKVKDSIITPFVQNVSQFPFTVNSLRIFGPDQNAFSLLSGLPEYTINGFSNSFGEFQFVPNRIGIHTAFVEVITQSDSVVIPIQGEGIEETVAQQNKLIDFGIIDVFTKKDSFNVTTIYALSTTPIQVTNAKIEGGSATSFSILSPFAGNTTISKIDTLKLDLQFFAEKVGRVQSNLILEHSGEGSPAVIALFGEGRDTAAKDIVIVAPIKEAFTNTFLTVPITLENNENFIFSSNAEVDFILRFNASVLVPRLAQFNGTIIGGERLVPLTFPLQTNAKGEIGSLELRVALGNVSSTPLFIDSVRIRNSNDRIGKRDGLVTIIDICEEGGTRLVNAGTKVLLALTSAQPSTEFVELELILSEKGFTKVDLVDIQGITVQTLFSGSPEFSKSRIRFSTATIQNGTYFIVLQTPTVQETIPVLIQR